jgi:hypothetical protein
VVSQALHWLAFLIVIKLMLLPTVQRNFSANATGLAIFTLLSLGTFTAGVHLPSWQVCLLGLIMALGIPALAWVENFRAVFLLITAGIAGLAGGIGAKAMGNRTSCNSHSQASLDYLRPSAKLTE